MALLLQVYTLPTLHYDKIPNSRLAIPEFPRIPQTRIPEKCLSAPFCQHERTRICYSSKTISSEINIPYDTNGQGSEIYIGHQLPLIMSKHIQFRMWTNCDTSLCTEVKLFAF